MNLTNNQCAILQAIRRRGGMSRIEIANDIGVTNGAVTRLTRELILLGLLEDGDKPIGQRGQPAIPLKISPMGGISCGISFGQRSVEFAALDFSGKVLMLETIETSSIDPEVVTAISQKLISKALKHRVRVTTRFLGLGVAVPAMFSAENSLLTSSAFKTWQQPNIREIFSKKISCPVWFENTGTAAAMAEYLAGSTVSARVSFVIYLSEGIGGGLIIDGRPYRGAFGNACEISVKFPIKAGPRPSYADLRQSLGLDTVGIELAKQIEMLWSQNDQRLVHWSEHAALQVIELCSAIHSFFDPDMIVLAGRLPRSMLEHMGQRVVEALEGEGRIQPTPKVIASELGSSITAVGAASIPTLNFVRATPLGAEIA